MDWFEKNSKKLQNVSLLTPEVKTSTEHIPKINEVMVFMSLRLMTDDVFNSPQPVLHCAY